MRSQFFGRDDDSDSNVGSGSGFFPNKFSTKLSQKTSEQITIEHPPFCPSIHQQIQQILEIYLNNASMNGLLMFFASND